MKDLLTPVRFSAGETPKCQIVEQDICPSTFDDKDLPTDVHIITYSVGDLKCHDAIRAYTKVDIFDIYYDKLKGVGTIHSITSGFGRIKPKLYGKIKSADSDDE